MKKTLSYQKWSCFLKNKQSFIDNTERFSKKGNPISYPDSLSVLVAERVGFEPTRGLLAP